VRSGCFEPYNALDLVTRERWYWELAAYRWRRAMDLANEPGWMTMFPEVVLAHMEQWQEWTLVAIDLRRRRAGESPGRSLCDAWSWSRGVRVRGRRRYV